MQFTHVFDRPRLCGALRFLSIGVLTPLLLMIAGERRWTKVDAGYTVVEETPKLYVLSIGIDAYPKDSKIIQLEFAVADAKGVASAFSSAQVKNVFPRVEITTLLDSDATLAATRTAFEHLVKVCNPMDVVIFYFGGVGTAVREAPSASGAGHSPAQFQFAMVDSTSTQNRGGIDGFSLQNPLTAKELSLLLLSIQAQRQIIILDTPYSAAAFDSLNAALNSDSVFTLHATGRKFVLLGTSGMAYERRELGHGEMTSALLDGMAGGADTQHTGYITEAELEGYMMAQLSSLAKGHHFLSKPEEFDEELLSYSDLRGLCLSSGTSQNPDCDPEYGYNPEWKPTEASRGMDVIEPPADEKPAERGTDYALILASDKYDHWPSLNNPIYDAQTLEQELVQNYDYAKQNIVYRENPTEDEIFDALSDLGKRTYGPNDRLLIYVAGHGHITSSGLGFLVTRETQLPDEHPYLKSALALSSLRDVIDQLPVHHILVVFDTCYSGIFKERKAIPAYSSENLDTPPSIDSLVADKMKPVSRLYIASGGLRAAYDGEPGMHSPFARTFLKTLRQYGGQDHIIDMGKLDGAVQGLCPHPYYGTFGIQQEGGDFLFVPEPGAHPVPDPGLDAKVPGPHCS